MKRSFCQKMSRLFTLSLLLVSVGCTSETHLFKLTPTTEGISDTMVNFFELERPIYKESVFQVKVVDIVSVQFKTSEYDVTIFRYRILIAPIENRPISIESIYIQPINPVIKSYLSSSPSLVGLGNLDEWNSLTKNLKSFDFKKVSEFTAYELEITLNDLAKEYLGLENIEKMELIKAMSNIELVINYNNKTEKISITDETIKFVNTDQDPILLDRSDLIDLINHGQTTNALVPYR